MGMMVQHWRSSRVCSWFRLSPIVLWEGAGQIPCGRLRETGIIAFLWKSSSYSSRRAGGNHAVLLTPTSLECSCYRACFGFHWGNSCHVLAILSLFQAVLGPSFVSQCGWHVCGHFLLSQTALWQFICHLVYKLWILCLIQSPLTSLGVCPLWWGRVLQAGFLDHLRGKKWGGSLRATPAASMSFLAERSLKSSDLCFPTI